MTRRGQTGAGPAGRSAGFVLVNALILVAALSAVALFMLARAEGARAHALAGQQSAQLGLYLSAFEALAITTLQADPPGAVDHLGEAWARSDYDVTLDRGRVSGQITDLQGLFNLNWLANPDDTLAQNSFDLLAARIGLSPQAGDAIRAFLRPGGPQGAAALAYGRTDPAVAPVGGAMVMMDQLAVVPGLERAVLIRLAEVAAVLPGDSALNINTAPAPVLASLFPTVTAVRLDQLIQVRRTRPFASVAAFLAAAGLETSKTGEDNAQDATDPGQISQDRLSVGSDWFGVRIRAGLDGAEARRTAVLHRRPMPLGVRVAWRVSRYD